MQEDNMNRLALALFATVPMMAQATITPIFVSFDSHFRALGHSIFSINSFFRSSASLSQFSASRPDRWYWCLVRHGHFGWAAA
jgi:hypothetical protein